MPVRDEQEKMRVSFDLDEVLFVNPKTHKIEPELPFPLRNIYKERLRLGTPELINKLQEMGYEVWVYTSSFRSERYIKGLFRHYGIKFDGIVNGEAVICSYGREYGFDAYQLDAQDDEWKEKVIAKAEEVKRKWERRRKAHMN